jgi:FKBP-type peptidyl-prolyl cis-trans isomerase
LPRSRERGSLPRMRSKHLSPVLASLLVFVAACVALAQETIPAPPDVAAAPADAQTTSSGLSSRVLQPGTGTEHPVPTDLVKVHYTGWTTDGKMFDSSVARGKPAVFPLNKVIAGWTEGLQLMVEGEKRRLWIPAKLAYEGRPDRPQGMLVFDVELLDILRVPPAPPDMAEPPADAERSDSGLAWKVLKPGTGTRRPGRDGNVRVHYTGWTTDGKMFDTSITKGAPAFFELDKVIPGWTEGLQLMTEGEVRRFWIPKKLAYRGAPGKPEGMLVFDIELVEVVKE